MVDGTEVVGQVGRGFEVLHAPWKDMAVLKSAYILEGRNRNADPDNESILEEVLHCVAISLAFLPAINRIERMI
jgi:hypothetical protein